MERQAWADGRLLGPKALWDFRKLTDEAFHDLRSHYFSPADLAAEMRRRHRRAKTAPPTTSSGKRKT